MNSAIDVINIQKIVIAIDLTDQSTTTKARMRIEEAEKIARLAYILSKMKVITIPQYDVVIWALNVLMRKGMQNDQLVK